MFPGVSTIFVYLRSVPLPLYGLIALGFFVHLFVWVYFFSSPNIEAHIAGDGVGYLTLAENLYDGKGFGQEFLGEGFVFETFRTPGLPALLTLFFSFGLGVQHYLFFISLLGAVIIPLCVYYIGTSLFERRVGYIASLLIAVEPLLFIQSWHLLTEMPFLIVLLLGLVFLIRTYKNKAILQYDALCASICFAVTVYIRPAVFPLLIISLLSVVVYLYVKERRLLTSFVFVLCVMGMLLMPWYVRMHELTGVYALSGTGWRNVYTDYLASIRALNHGTRFIDEKNALKRYAVEQFGITHSEINSPAQSDTFKRYALPEILDNKKTVIKLQTLLFVSYFTHSDYQRRLQKFGLLPMNKVEQGRTSSSVLFIEKGIRAFPFVYTEMKNRYFIPVFERVWTGSLFVLAIIGFFATRSPARYLIFLLLVLGYLTSSAIGLGVEGRLRIPILPFYFMLASCGMLWLWSTIPRYLPWKK